MEEQKSKVRLGEQKPSVCRLCFSVACNFHFLNDIQQDMIEIIFPELNLGVCSNLVLCQECVDNLEELFTFKSTCLDIEESLHNYMVEGQKQIDLDKITGLKGMDAQHDNLGRFSKLCRTCLELTEPDDITELVENDNNMVLEILATCFPEVDINLTIQAIICKKCVNLIQKYYTFFNKCMENETKIHIYLESHPTQELTLYNVLNLNYSSKQQTNNDMCKSQSPKISENKTEKPKETLKQFSTNKNLTDLRDKDVLNNSNEKQDSEMNSNNDVQISVNDIDVNMPSDSRGSFNSLDDRDNFETENTKSDSNISSDENELLKPQQDSLSSNNQNNSVDANTERVNENDNQNIRKRTINDEENDNVHSVDGSQENTPYNTRKKKLKITTDAHDVQNDDVVNDPDFVQHKQGNSTPYNTRKKQHKKIIDDDGEQEDNVAEDPDFVVKTNEQIEDFDDLEEPENIQSKKQDNTNKTMEDSNDTDSDLYCDEETNCDNKVTNVDDKEERDEEQSDQKLRMNNKYFNFFFKCTNCLAEFHTEQLFDRHFVVCNKKDLNEEVVLRVFECEYCTIRRNSSIEIYTHLRLHHMSRNEFGKFMIYHCSECCRQYNKEEDKCHQVDPVIYYKCPNCTYLHSNLYKFYMHLSTHRLYLKQYCLICYKSLTEPHTDHTDLATKLKIYCCCKCHYHCDQQFVLINHIQKAHKVESQKQISKSKSRFVKCHKCFVFRSKKNIALHSNKQHYSCRHCSFQTINPNKLLVHEKCHSLKNTYLCNICFDIFKAKYNLKQHKLSHIPPEKVTCDLCPKTFLRASSLEAHKRKSHMIF